MKMTLLLSSNRQLWPIITVFLVVILAIVNSVDSTDDELDQLEFQFYDIFENDTEKHTLENILRRKKKKFETWCNNAVYKAKRSEKEATGPHKIYRKKRPQGQDYISLKAVKCATHDRYPYRTIYRTFYLIPKEKQNLYILVPIDHENMLQISDRISYK